MRPCVRSGSDLHIACTPDGGKTWELGAVGQQGTRESQVVQLPSLTADAQLYASERNMGAKPGEFSIPNGHNFTINLIFENHSRQEDARAIFPLAAPV